jgi:ribonuclease D
VPGSGPQPASSAPLYLDSAASADRFLASIASARTIAVDTEGASFHRFVDRIYLLQISAEHRHAIIDPLRVETPHRLGSLLESPDVEVVFHDADYDLRLLHQDYGWQVTNIFDTRVAAQLLGIKAFGLAALLQTHFGVQLDKKHQRADWSMRPLPPEMLEYAAQDTMHLVPLRDHLKSALEERGRWAWAREEFQRLEGTRWEEEDGGNAFLRMKGARDLTRRQLAVLRELVTWREGVARGMDRSTFRVAGNEVLLALSQSLPASIAELERTKGLSRGLIPRLGPDILAAIERGKAVPESDLPRFPKAQRWNRDPDYEDRVSRLKVVRDQLAAELELDPGVLCARERLEAVARRNPHGLDELAEVTDIRKWQIDLLGTSFLRALRNGVESDSPYRD